MFASQWLGVPFHFLFMLFLTFASHGTTYRLARRVEQSLVNRAPYSGGWPLAAVPCPAEASVACSTGIDSQINQQCCPSGNTCFGWPSTTPPVCCPSSQNCVGQLQNLPVCANSSWNMYDLGDNNYFCCEQGQVGVMPQSGYAGICQAEGQPVPSSQLASTANQIGGTLTGTSVTSFFTSGRGNTAEATSVGSSSSGQGSSPSSSSSNNATSSSSSSIQIGSGAIAGIAIGVGIVIAALIFVVWKSCSRKPKALPYGQSSQQMQTTYDPTIGRPFQPGITPAHEFNANPIMSSTSRIHEVSGENALVEMASR